MRAAIATTKNKPGRQREIIQIRAEINNTETKKIIARINKVKSQFFEKMNKIDNFQPGSSKKKKNKERETERGLKSVKLEMRKEKLQLTPQKDKGL